MIHNDISSAGIFSDLLGLGDDKGDAKDETRNRLNELVTFALCGFGILKP